MSWWDGFWAFYVNHKIFNRKYHFMMLEKQLRKYWYFNYTGGYSVNKGTKSVVETIRYTLGLLSNPENMVLIFPQGKIQTMHRQTFQFEKGIEHILKEKEGKVQIMFMANLVDYFSAPKPIVNCYIQEYEDLSYSLESIQNQYNGFYGRCVEAQKEIEEE